jgi:hypothetical protein
MHHWSYGWPYRKPLENDPSEGPELHRLGSSALLIQKTADFRTQGRHTCQRLHKGSDDKRTRSMITKANKQRQQSGHPLRCAIYSRVSTDRQTTQNQERELRAIAERAGWIVVNVYRDQGISGAKSRNDRPAFDALCKDAARRQFDIVTAWSVDRLGRSLQDLVAFLSELHAIGIDLLLHQQGVDTTTPAGKALFQMMGVFAEFERAMIR